jgi:hypothetical protein
MAHGWSRFKEKVMRHLFLSACVLAICLSVQPSTGFAADLPKCRNVAGYEPKMACEARNQRAQWQAEETARLTAKLMADALAAQAEAEGSFVDTTKQFMSDTIDTIKGFF